MRDFKQIEIGGRTYTVQQLGAKDGFSTFVKLTKLIGPSVGALGAGAAGLKEAAQMLAANLDETQAWGIVELFARHTSFVSDSGANLPLTGALDLFSGKFDQMFEWLEFCLDFNYESFLVSIASRKGLAAKTPSESRSQSQVT
jgi:hypothetical protein